MNPKQFDLLGPDSVARSQLEPQAIPHLLLDQLPIGIFHKDIDGRYVFVNTWFCRLKEAPAEEFLGKTADEVAAAKPKGPRGNSRQFREIKMFNDGANHHKLIIQ